MVTKRSDAILLLTQFNRWRRGDDNYKQPNPTDIGIALEIAIRDMRVLDGAKEIYDKKRKT